MNEGLPSPFVFTTCIGRLLRFCCWILGVTACVLSDGRLHGEVPPVSGGPLFRGASTQFKAMTSTLYQHKTEVDRTTGSYRYDCVGFVSYALKQAAPQAWDSAFKACGIAKGRIPSPPAYRAFFASLVEKPQAGWQAVTKASELRPGDVVCWEKRTETSSGHAVVIGSVPVAGPDGIWLVEVFDSTASSHGDDSRPGDPRATLLPATGKRSGLGHGVMAFTADPNTGVLSGYRWSPKSKTYTVPIAAGRPIS